jgi:uncharacterized protein YfaT (DUF1175 family)
MKIYSISLVVRKMQIETTKRCYSTPNRMVIITQKQAARDAGEDWGKQDCSGRADANERKHNHLGKHFGSSSKY